MNRLTPYFALTDRQPSYQGDMLHLGKANCPVPTQVEPIIFTELGGGCDDEHLKRVEPRKGDGESIVVCWPSFIFWTGYAGFVVAVIVWLVRLFG